MIHVYRRLPMLQAGYHQPSEGNADDALTTLDRQFDHTDISRFLNQYHVISRETKARKAISIACWAPEVMMTRSGDVTMPRSSRDMGYLLA